MHHRGEKNCIRRPEPESPENLDETKQQSSHTKNPPGIYFGAIVYPACTFTPPLPWLGGGEWGGNGGAAPISTQFFFTIFLPATGGATQNKHPQERTDG